MNLEGGEGPEMVPSNGHLFHLETISLQVHVELGDFLQAHVLHHPLHEIEGAGERAALVILA